MRTKVGLGVVGLRVQKLKIEMEEALPKWPRQFKYKLMINIKMSDNYYY